jgi:hypothetical protein
VRGRQERERQEYEAAFRAAEALLLQDLAHAGVVVESAWTLVNTAESYPEAIPVLVAHLQRDYPDRVLEGGTTQRLTSHHLPISFRHAIARPTRPGTGEVLAPVTVVSQSSANRYRADRGREKYCYPTADFS